MWKFIYVRICAYHLCAYVCAYTTCKNKNTVLCSIYWWLNVTFYVILMKNTLFSFLVCLIWETTACIIIFKNFYFDNRVLENYCTLLSLIVNLILNVHGMQACMFTRYFQNLYNIGTKACIQYICLL